MDWQSRGAASYNNGWDCKFFVFGFFSSYIFLRRIGTESVFFSPELRTLITCELCLFGSPTHHAHQPFCSCSMLDALRPAFCLFFGRIVNHWTPRARSGVRPHARPAVVFGHSGLMRQPC